MLSIPYFLIGAVIGAVSVWVYMNQKIKESEREMKSPEQESQEQEEDASGLGSFNEKRQKKIERRKDKIVEAIKKKGSIQTREVSDMLDISSRTALRYLSELEEEGRIRQTDETGRSAGYELAERGK